MYCTHCAKHINEDKIEAKQSSYAPINGEVVETEEGAEINYICPRCGHLIHHHISEEEEKSLARATHAQIQRARNNLNVGFGFAIVGVILGILSIIFLFLARKPSNQYQLVTTCAEYYVFLALGIVSICLLAAGIAYIVLGIIKRKANVALLKEINDKTFFQ